MSSYLQGALVESRVTFFDTTTSTNIDPTTVQFKVRNEAGTTSYTYGDGDFIFRIEEGVYAVTLDTTPMAGLWIVQWIAPPGTGQAVGEAMFVVTTTQIPV